MAFKDEWKDLKDATVEAPNSGDDISVEPINRMAHQVILNEENIIDKVDKEDGKGLSTNDFTDEYKEKVDKSGEQVQSDWSQNDETAPDYVKNRTHYDMPKVLLGENHLTVEDAAHGDGQISAYFEFVPEIDKEYKYYINGEEGTFVITELPQGDGWEYEIELIIGSTSGMLYRTSADNYLWTVYCGYKEAFDIVLYEGGELKQLDEKYIPDSIARTADVEEILDELHAYAQNLIGGDA